MHLPGRHELVWLSTAGWDRLLRGCDPSGAGLLAHWASADLPLVATRRPPGMAATELALGLPAPRSWGSRRLALAARCSEVARLGGFPTLPEAVAALASRARQPLRDVADGLGVRAAAVRVYGSHGWQVLSGLDCLREGSDLDLLLPAGDEAEAAWLCERLDRGRGALRIDGELLLPNGRAVAWREWHRPGAARQVLVKHLHGAELMPRDRLWSSVGLALA